MALRRVRVLRGHTAHARFNALVHGPVGEIPRQAEIPSPYAFGPTWPVFRMSVTDGSIRQGTDVVIRETRHARYEVFEVES